VPIPPKLEYFLYFSICLLLVQFELDARSGKEDSVVEVPTADVVLEMHYQRCKHKHSTCLFREMAYLGGFWRLLFLSFLALWLHSSGADAA
jgi:hypothetical protein